MAWTTDTNIYMLNLPKHPSEFNKFKPAPDFLCNCGLGRKTHEDPGYRYTCFAARLGPDCSGEGVESDPESHDSCCGSNNYAPSWSPNGQYVLYGCREREQFESDKAKLKLYHLESDSTRDITKSIDLSCDSVEWESIDDDSMSFYVNAQYQGAYRVFRFTVAKSLAEVTGNLKLIVNEIKVMNGDNQLTSPKYVSSKCGKGYLYFLESSLLSPPELKVATIDASKKDEQLFSIFATNNTENEMNTNSSIANYIDSKDKLESYIKPLTLNESRNILTVHVCDVKFTNNDIAMPSHVEKHYFKGGNDEWVQAYYMPPVNNRTGEALNQETGSTPLAVIIHGGPQGAILNQWHYRWNMSIFAARGYGVLAINFHGSTGFGQDFTDSITGDWGGAPYDDIIIGTKYILNHYKYLNLNKVCALGASYGGYMINWLNGHNPDKLFKCFVNHDGVFNSTAMYFSTEELWFSEWEFGLPWEKEEIYKKFSPHNYVKNWQTPTLVIQGGKDYRVPDSEGIATFTALQRLKVSSKFLYFPDENHWVLKPANSIKWHETIFEWLETYI